MKKAPDLKRSHSLWDKNMKVFSEEYIWKKPQAGGILGRIKHLGSLKNAINCRK